MRLWFQLDASVPTPPTDRRLLYSVDAEAAPTIESLAKKLALDLGMKGELYFSLGDGYVVFPGSGVEILRETDVVTVSARSALDSDALPSKPESTTSTETGSSGSSTSEDSSGDSVASSASSDETPTPMKPLSNQKTVNGVEPESSSSEEATSDSSTSESSEESEPDRQELSEGDAARQQLPGSPLPKWHPVTHGLAVGDAVMYRFVELSATWCPQETDWRYGIVESVPSAVPSQGAENWGNAVVCLAPWPDVTVHPDPKYELKRQQCEEETSEEEETPKRVLEVPQSEYSETGRLVKQLQEFTAIHRVDPTFAKSWETNTGTAKSRQNPESGTSLKRPQELPKSKPTPTKRRKSKN